MWRGRPRPRSNSVHPLGYTGPHDQPFTMDKLLYFGRYIFAIAFAAFGIQHFIYAKYAAGLGPPWIPGSPLRACFMGAALLIASIRIAANSKTRVTAMLLAFLLFLYFLLLYAPRLAANLHDPGPWTSGAEILALSGASWIPARLFWANAVGIAFIATTLSLLTNIKARLAATLLGLMFLTWVLILHLPRVAAAPHNGNEWTSAFVALAMCGGAWMIAVTVPE